MTEKPVLEVLLLEDHDFYVADEMRAIETALGAYKVNMTRKKSIRELIEGLQESHYDLIFVDFDMQESSWFMDAFRSALEIEKHQPGAIKIGITVDDIAGDLKTPFGSVNELLIETYPIIIGREEMVKQPEYLKEMLGKYGI